MLVILVRKAILEHLVHLVLPEQMACLEELVLPVN